MDLVYFLDFIMFGIVMNFLSLIPLFVVLLYRVGTLQPKEFQEYIRFLKMAKTLSLRNSPLKRFARMMLIFIPTYLVYINTVVMYYLIRHSGVFGLIKSAIGKETFSIIPLIKFQVISVPTDQ